MANINLASTTKGLRDMQFNLQAMEKRANALNSINKDVLIRIYTDSANKHRREILGFLRDNLKSSEVGKDDSDYKQTGKLASAVMGSTIDVRLNGNTPTLLFSLPAGVAPYKDGKAESNFYKVAASLQYGSVRTPKYKKKVKTKTGEKEYTFGALGKKAKRKLKFGLGVELKGSTVVRAKPFFYLTDGQWEWIEQKFSEDVNEYLKNFIGV